MLIVNTIKDITSIIIIFYKILILLSIFFINFIVNIFVCLQIMKCFSTSNLMTLSATGCTLCSFLVFPSLASLSSFKRLALSDLELIFYRFYFNTNMKERLKSFFFSSRCSRYELMVAAEDLVDTFIRNALSSRAILLVKISNSQPSSYFLLDLFQGFKMKVLFNVIKNTIEKFITFLVKKIQQHF